MKKILSIIFLLLFAITGILLAVDVNISNSFKKLLRLINVLGWGYVLYQSYQRNKTSE